MTDAPVPRDVDLRGFRSRLSPLRTKLDTQLQAARGALAACKTAVAALSEDVRDLRERGVGEAGAVREGLRGSLDTVVHAHSLRHLMNLGRQLEAREAALREAEDKVADSMKACLEQDRQLAVVRRLQQQELRAHAASEARRQNREADLAWLARTQGGVRE